MTIGSPSLAIQNTDSFRYHDEDDEYLYHVTSVDRAEKICDTEFSGKSKRMFGSSYQEHSKNRVFLTEKSGVMFWMARVEDRLFDEYDEPPEVAVLKIPKHLVSTHLTADEIGTTDARHNSYFINVATLNELIKKPVPTAGVELNEEFSKWFADSKVVDGNGAPLVLYHGTVASFTEFRTSGGWFGEGVYFTPDADVAAEFAEDMDDEHMSGTNIIPVYLSLRNPYVFQEKDIPQASNLQLMREIGLSEAKIEKIARRGINYSTDAFASAITEQLQKMGYDGLKAVSLGDEIEYVAFEPSQIKFAIAKDWDYDLQERLDEVMPRKTKLKLKY